MFLRVKAGFFAAVLLAVASACAAPLARAQSPHDPALFTFDELVQLYRQDPLPPALAEKLQRLQTTPFVRNEAASQGMKPVDPEVPGLGRCLRIVSWNIERGIEFDSIRLAFTDPEKFAQWIEDQNGSLPPEGRKRIREQAEQLRRADVIVLNEVDRGLQRTNYRFVAAELAVTLGMNFAYGVEFVEVDPVLLGLSPHPLAPRKVTLASLSAADRIEAEAALSVDKARYLGLHGNAILSRYPLENIRAIPYRFQGHDWYKDEKKKISKVEKGRREASELAFHEEISRQVRRGGRMMLLAEIVDPDLPTGRALIVATHIEDVTKPKNRVQQLKELLAIVRAARHPVILAGDMNTSGHDISPLTVARLIRRQLGNKRFWLLEAAKMEVRGGPFLDVVLGGVDLVRTEDDPTVTNIPTLFGNPEANFFRVLERFRFADGGAFDFRGDPQRSVGHHQGTLANSNQRAGKGFVSTFAVTRTIGPEGRSKLDWIFVKPGGVTDPRKPGQPYRFAPHFGRTLVELNHALPDRISDHNPILVDLPLQEPGPLDAMHEVRNKDAAQPAIRKQP